MAWHAVEYIFKISHVPKVQVLLFIKHIFLPRSLIAYAQNDQ